MKEQIYHFSSELKWHFFHTLSSYGSVSGLYFVPLSYLPIFVLVCMVLIGVAS